MTPLQKQLLASFPNYTWLFDEPLSPLTYAKIGGAAEALLKVTDPEIAASVIKFCTQSNIRCTYLGGASNVLIDDAGISGVVLQYQDTTVRVIQSVPSKQTIVFIASGTKTALAVSKTVALGLTGLEYFLGVPGTIGGAIYNNAHYLSDLIDKHILRVQAITEHGDIVWYTHDACAFDYEQSRFQSNHELIVGAEFALTAGDPETSKAKIAQATQYRAASQPLGIPSSGCMFRNPANTPTLRQLFPQFADKDYIPAGYLIDQAGLKGERVGAVSVSKKHAAWIINGGNGTSADVKKLVSNIQKKIVEKYGVQLETEVFFLSDNTDESRKNI